jgi:hypothetical protein
MRPSRRKSEVDLAARSFSREGNKLTSMGDKTDHLYSTEVASSHASSPAPQTWAQARPLLRSILRPAIYAGLLKPGEPTSWRVSATPFVHELVALDFSESPVTITTEHTARWGVSSAEVFSVARHNIAALHPVGAYDKGAGGIFRDTETRSYIGSAILTPGWLASFTPPPGTRTIAFLPTEDTLIVGYDDPVEGAHYFDTAEQLYRESERPVSPQAFIECDGQVLAFDKCGLHPLRPLALRARSCEAERIYRDQTEFLNRTYQSAGFDCRAVSVHVFELGHRSVTAAAWPRGVVADLPEVDYIIFLGGSDERFAVPFSVVTDILGLLPSAGFYPPRYRVTAWPESDMLDVLRFHALPLPGS